MPNVRNRRTFLQAAAATPLLGLIPKSPNDPSPKIIDTHQHLWEIPRQSLPWLAGAPEVLRTSYTTAKYREATAGLNVVGAVYMEVDVAPDQLEAEAESILASVKKGQSPTKAAVIGGRPASPKFADYLARFHSDPAVKGVRQVLHGAETPRGFCRSPEFVAGVRALGKAGLRFDLCMRPAELPDGLALAQSCPDTTIIVDHCGNADPKAFRPGTSKPSHDPDAWKRAMEALATRPNVVCKISGIVASAPKGWTPDDLAPVINHCLDAFGPDRVVFGGDWPVCLLGATYRQWVEALRSVVASRPEVDRAKLWHDNAKQIYALG